MEIHTVEEFLPYLDSVRHRTERVAACIPPDRIEWSHRPGAFSFGDLLRHLAATERWMFVENVLGRPSRYPGHGRELADGHDAVLTYLRAMHDESVRLLSSLTPDDLRRRCATPAGAEITAWKWLRSMVEHEAHHRGQIHLMLGVLGVVAPPLYGLTEEQVRENSLPADG